jgi:hypothetical protein
MVESHFALLAACFYPIIAKNLAYCEVFHFVGNLLPPEITSLYLECHIADFIIRTISSTLPCLGFITLQISLRVF